MERDNNNLIQKPALETALAIAAGLSFYMLCMILPLVGPAGSRVPHAARNATTFVTVLVITLILSGASTYVSLQRRKAEGGPLPLFSISVGTISILFLVILLTNGFAI